MKVILNENIETLGHIGDIVKVAPGYARNYLLPKNLAVAATEKNAKALEHTKRQMAYKKNKALESAKNLGARLEALSSPAVATCLLNMLYTLLGLYGAAAAAMKNSS